MNKIHGLREKIKNSNSKEEVNELLKLGKTFEFVSPVTKRAWTSTAKFRLAQLESNDPAQESKSSVKSEKKKVSKKK